MAREAPELWSNTTPPMYIVEDVEIPASPTEVLASPIGVHEYKGDCDRTSHVCDKDWETTGSLDLYDSDIPELLLSQPYSTTGCRLSEYSESQIIPDYFKRLCSVIDLPPADLSFELSQQFEMEFQNTELSQKF